MHWDPDSAVVADTAADDSDSGDNAVVDCILEDIGLEHYDRNPGLVDRYVICQCQLKPEDREEPTNNPYGPEGYLHHRPHIGPLADRAESLHVVEVHKDSPGQGAYSRLGHHHIEAPETDTLVVRKVAGHMVAAAHSLGTDRGAGPDEGWETELRSSEEVDCRDSTWSIFRQRTNGMVWVLIYLNSNSR